MQQVKGQLPAFIAFVELLNFYKCYQKVIIKSFPRGCGIELYGHCGCQMITVQVLILFNNKKNGFMKFC